MPDLRYQYGPEEFARLLIAKSYPERTDEESAIIRDFLLAHLHEFDHVYFSVRIGKGRPPDPDHLPGVQRQTVLGSQKRIDVVAMQGQQVYLIEAKKRVGHEVIGQLLMDRQLWLEDSPDGLDPRLVAIGRTSDEEALRVLTTHGIAVYLYEAPTAQ